MPRENRECRGDLGQPVAVAVPGRLRKRQIEQCGEPLRDLEPAVAERGERAGRAAELQHQRLAPQPLQPLARTRQRRRVAGEFEPERHGHGVLHPGARHGGGAAMTRGERGEPCDGTVEVGDEGIDRRAQLEHERAVDDVLAGGPPMDVARRCRIGLGDLGGERIDQRDGDIAGGHRGLAQRREVVAVGAGGLGDPLDGERRDDADLRFRARERNLEIEHALHARAIVEDRAHGRARDQRGQQ